MKVNYTAEKDGVSSALREMYDEIDEFLLAGDFDRCNEILRSVDTDFTPLTILIGYLTITLTWRENLSERGALFQRTRQAALRELSQTRVENLLKGLE